MAAAYADMAKIERQYANALIKLSGSAEYSVESYENKAPLSSSVVSAWNAVKADVSSRARAHLQFADQLSMHVEAPLSELRKKLSARKDALEAAINDSAADLRKAQESHHKLKLRHDKLQSEVASKGTSSKLTANDVSMAFDAVANAQLHEYKMQNAHYRICSDSLSKLQELELERIQATRTLLLTARHYQSQMERAYLRTEPVHFTAVEAVDPVTEVLPWVDQHASKAPCPWSNNKVAPQAQSPTAHTHATPAGAGGSAAAPQHARTASVSVAGLVAPQATSSTLSQSPARSPRPPSSDPKATPRKPRSTRDHNRILSPEAVAIVAASSPILAELATVPADAIDALPPHLRSRAKDIPFPTIGLPKHIEPLPSSSWMPNVASLFPADPAASLPDMSSLALTAVEYNRLVYEQMLLSTNLLQDISKEEHRATILAVVRVQLHIPQFEHELLLRVLATDTSASQDPSSPSPAPASASASPSPSPSIPSPAPAVSDAMGFVHYRVSLMRCVKSSLFPSLHAYRTWFKRQVHAVWLSVLWTMQAQVSRSNSGRSAAAPSTQGHTTSNDRTLSLATFKATLQLVQLLSFTVSSKVDTKLFAMGDAAGDAAHPDLVSQLTELELTLSRFPAPYTSLVASALHYPQLLLNKVYQHMMHVSCIAGGDEQGLPMRPDTDPLGDSESDADDDPCVRLHSSYLAVIACLSYVRTQWHISDFSHHYSLLYLVLHIIYHQAAEYDGKLLDADGMVEGDGSILPLVAHISNALCGHLRPEVLALAPLPPSEKRIKPEQLDEEETSFMCFALRNVGYALSDFHRFQAKPVAVCFQFYHDVSVWMGVKDVPARMDRFLRISATNFYQTLIPTESQLLMASFLPTGGASSTLSPPHDSLSPNGGKDDGSGRAGVGFAPPAASIQITPKRMHTWNAEEWRAFSKQLCECMQDQIEEFHPAFAANKSLAQLFAAPKEGSQKEAAGQDVAASVADGSRPVRPHASEMCILQLIKCFAQDVSALMSDRAHHSSGMDDTLLSLVSCLVRIQTLLMDSRYMELWSSHAVKAQIAAALPQLPELCIAALARWMDVQKQKVEGITQRCVLTDQWVPVDEAGGLRYSHSVTDLFNFLHTLHDAFWSHARALQGYGVAESLPALLQLLNDTLCRYGEHVLHTAGLDVLPQLFPSKDTKLKQARAEPSDKDKAKAFLKGMFKKDGKEGKAEEVEAAASPNPDVLQSGIVLHSRRSLCVRLCCMEATIDQSSDLSVSLRTQQQAFLSDFPIVGQAGKRYTGDVKELDAGARLFRRWHEWRDCFVAPSQLPPEQPHLFAGAVEQLRAHIDQLAAGVGVVEVYVAWRASWITKLYAPQPMQSNRIQNGELLAKVEEAMPQLHASVTRSLFPLLCKHILTHLMGAVTYVLLYGRRAIQEEHVHNIVLADVAELRGLFAKVLHPLELDAATRDIQQLLQVMQTSTDDLIRQYTSNQCPLPAPIMARIIAARSGKAAQKLIDKIRGK